MVGAAEDGDRAVVEFQPLDCRRILKSAESRILT
jgi:hypothetical protein